MRLLSPARSLFIAFFAPIVALAQTNTFPSSGNVGIGTTTPARALDVFGDIRAYNTLDRAITAQTSGITRGASLQALADTAALYTYALGSSYGGSQAGISYNNQVLSEAQHSVAYVLSTSDTAPIVFTPNRSEAMRITDGGNVGIGTTSPAEKLDVAGNLNGGRYLRLSDGTNPFMRLAKTGGTARTLDINGGDSFALTWAAGGSGTFVFDNAGNVGIGTASPVSTLTVLSSTNNAIPSLSSVPGGSAVFGNTGTGGILSLGQDNAAHSWLQARDSTATGSAYSLLLNPLGGNVGIGTTNPTQKLSVNGTIRAKEVIVDTGWSDYVFAKDYRLASLNEVERAIEKDGHLPGIPSAQEVAEHGVTVGEMQSKLLAKIEELTLHQIEQEKRQSAQQEQISAQADRIQKLEAENAALRFTRQPQ